MTTMILGSDDDNNTDTKVNITTRLEGDGDISIYIEDISCLYFNHTTRCFGYYKLDSTDEKTLETLGIKLVDDQDDPTFSVVKFEESYEEEAVIDTNISDVTA